MTLYDGVKLIHVLSSTVLFGTGLGTAFQMWMTHRGGDIRAIAATAHNVVWADFLFTTPAVIIQPLTGFILMDLAGFDPRAHWLEAAYALYLLTGACWLPVVAIQIKTSKLARIAAATDAPLPTQYFHLMRWWFWLGWPAFAAVLAIFWLMVAKPALW